VVDDKYVRVRQFHRNMLAALGELVGAAGLAHPPIFGPCTIRDAYYAEQWALADAQSFGPLPYVKSAA